MLKKVLKIGHRGAAGLCEENTLAAFRKAIEVGADMVELDVHLKDGKLFVVHDFKDLNEKTPVLEQVIDLVDKKAVIDIELKGDRTARPTAAVLKKYINRGWSNEDFLVSSFKTKELEDFKKINQEIKLGFLVENKKTDILKTAQELGVFSVIILFKITNKKLIDELHDRGFKVFVWTVNKKKDIEKMKKMGVDGICSDYPNRL